MPVTTYIDLLRHGETEGGSRFRGSIDDSLTVHGWQQMQDSIHKVETRWDCCITSPLKRCANFASDISRQLSIPLIIKNDLKEMHFGDWEGKSAKEIMDLDSEALGNFWKNPVENSPPNAEPLLEFKARVDSILRQVIHDHQGERLLLITHGGVIRTILCLLQNKPINQLLEFEVSHAALIQSKIDDSFAQIIIDGVTI